MSLTHHDFDDIDLNDDLSSWNNFGESRAERRRRKQQSGQRNKISRQQVLDTIVEENDTATDFVPTYVKNLDEGTHERTWILESLSDFYLERVIDDVLAIVKGGKEANVYSCKATPETGLEMIAAKLYRPRMLRHLKNDSLYKEGRLTRDKDGKEIRGNRTSRALKKKTRFGQDVDFATWIVHEFRIHNELYQAGLDVPQPIAHRNNTILMAYIGDAHGPGHTLIDTTLTDEEAQPLFDRIMFNIEQMLRLNYVHGDLSAYNILYWDGAAYIIDFPQVVDARSNGNTYTFLERDITRVCEYFARYGVESDPVGLALELWQAYQDGQL